MKPYYADDWLTVYHGDCREAMAAMEPESVNCVVTSPPYWGLRDYGTATWVGGDEGCDHKQSDRGPTDRRSSTLGGGVATIAAQDAAMAAGPTCRKCGASRVDGQLGLERTPEEYVANLVAVFREVRRVLRNDGTVWLNLGDSYAANGPGNNGNEGYGDGRTNRTARLGGKGVPGLKPKDLVGIPWRVAFALQADGWYLRSDIIWSKPNPMPESVTDRPTKSHEYLFLLSKSPRYYFDADAVREPHVREWKENNGGTFGPVTDGGKDRILGGTKDHKGPYPLPNPAGRNIRSVWTIATQPYLGAHFATYPPKLVEPCIKAGCPEGGTVLDPFAGSGTTGMVAQSLSRKAVLIDLSLDYLDQLMARNADIPLGLGA